MANRPTPSRLRELSGSNLHRLNKREAPFRKVESLVPPKWMAGDELALEEFHRLAPELVDNGLLTRANFQAFCKLCAAHSRGVKAELDVQARGIMIEDPVFDKHGAQVGTKRKANPMLVEARNAAFEYLRIAIEFGLTPAAATRVAAEPAEEKKASFGEFLPGDEEKTAEKLN